MSRSHDLLLLGKLTDRHLGRTVAIDGGLTGTLVGLIPVSGMTSLALITPAGQRAWTSALPNDTAIEVSAKEKAS